MIEIRDRRGDSTFYLAVDLIEAIFEREGNMSEIRTTTGRLYTSIESKDSIAEKVNISRDHLREVESES